MDEIRRAAEAAERVDVLHVPGGHVAGMPYRIREFTGVSRQSRPRNTLEATRTAGEN